ncbi:MAG: hypothetical protein ACHP8A_05570 [Terriglobales bacterium]
MKADRPELGIRLLKFECHFIYRFFWPANADNQAGSLVSGVWVDKDKSLTDKNFNSGFEKPAVSVYD